MFYGEAKRDFGTGTTMFLDADVCQMLILLEALGTQH
jgi:hypothetical protein